MNEKVKIGIEMLPHQPGCYLMHNADGKIIYVGKAKDLFKRVSQYFMRPQSGKVFKMVMEVDYFETIVTKTEKEALLLELNLIKTHYPRYNILLKDGKSYPFIAIKKGQDPYLSILRHDKDKRFIYFGPFPNSGAAYDMVSLLNKLFPLRKCKTLPNSPCLYYHLNQCLGPCINKISQDTYDSLVDDIRGFLQGNNKKIRQELNEKMRIMSETLEFEKAQEYKTLIDAIDYVAAKQTVQRQDHTDKDVFAYSLRNGYLALNVMLYRRGMLLGQELFVVDEFNDIEEQISSMIVQFYTTHSLPKEVIISISTITEILSDALNIKVSSPTKGAGFAQINDAQVNAIKGLDEHFMTARLDDNKLELLEELGKILSIKTPLHIELFDNSHHQGADPVGALVVFINGEKVKKMYRKFHITHEEKRDDFASMKEVSLRRYKRLLEGNEEFPDLILVDGGLIQISAIKSSLDELNISIPIAGLFKNSKHQTEGLLNAEGEVFPLANNSPLFYLLMRMQDEVHRYAISFHRNQHIKNYKKSILDDIPMLGDKRKQLLFNTYKDISELKKATPDELSQLLPRDLAQKVYNKLHLVDEN